MGTDGQERVTGPCAFYVDPFSEEDGRCGRVGEAELFRHKREGSLVYGFRCEAHHGMSNDQWELVSSDESPPS